MAVGLIGKVASVQDKIDKPAWQGVICNDPVYIPEEGWFVLVMDEDGGLSPVDTYNITVRLGK